jgi:hypothetical protein
VLLRDCMHRAAELRTRTHAHLYSRFAAKPMARGPPAPWPCSSIQAAFSAAASQPLSASSRWRTSDCTSRRGAGPNAGARAPARAPPSASLLRALAPTGCSASPPELPLLLSSSLVERSPLLLELLGVLRSS